MPPQANRVLKILHLSVPPDSIPHFEHVALSTFKCHACALRYWMHIYIHNHTWQTLGVCQGFRCLVPNHRFIIGVTNIDLFLLLLSHFTSWVTNHLSAYQADIESSFSFFFFFNSSQRFFAASVSSLFAYKPVSSAEAQSWLSKWKPLKFSFFN